MKTKFYPFFQNNSGGRFDVNHEKGISEVVIIEAENEGEANERAESIGLYFNGCVDDIDCDCCGDRWSEVEEWEGTDNPIEIVSSYRAQAYIHYIDETIKQVKLEDETKI